jgi:hypothetical protein
MASFDDTFAAELRALRPTPSPDFTAKLDERAAAGFPRRPDDGGGKSLWERLRAWFTGLTPRRALVPGGAFALVAVVVATAVVAISNSAGTSGDHVVRHSIEESGMATGGSESGGAAAPASPQRDAPKRQGLNGLEKGGPAHAPSQASEAAGAEIEVESGKASAGIEFLPSTPGKGAKSGGGGGNGVSAGGTAGDSFAPRNRDIERSASIVLGTTPDKLAEASARVYQAVHTANGIVLHSTTHSSRHGGEASFDLLIPSGRLNNALGTFSGIAEVRSRHDATTDITAPTVSVAEELQDSNARIESLIAQLGEAESEAEREAVEGELRGERDHHAALRASLERLEDRASMSRVSLRIISGHGAGVAPSGDSGSWGVGDALHDAGHILAVAGGVAIIGLAVLGPIALILLAAWLLNRFRVRRLRERALD